MAIIAKMSAAAIAAKYQAKGGGLVRSINSLACCASGGLGESASTALASRRAATMSPALYNFHAFFIREPELAFGACPFATGVLYTGESESSSTVYTSDAETSSRSAGDAGGTRLFSLVQPPSVGVRRQRAIHTCGGAAWRPVGWATLRSATPRLGATAPYFGGSGTGCAPVPDKQPQAVRVPLPLFGRRRGPPPLLRRRDRKPSALFDVRRVHARRRQRRHQREWVRSRLPAGNRARAAAHPA